MRAGPARLGASGTHPSPAATIGAVLASLPHLTGRGSADLPSHAGGRSAGFVRDAGRVVDGGAPAASRRCDSGHRAFDAPRWRGRARCADRVRGDSGRDFPLARPGARRGWRRSRTASVVVGRVVLRASRSSTRSCSSRAIGHSLVPERPSAASRACWRGLAVLSRVEAEPAGDEEARFTQVSARR